MPGAPATGPRRWGGWRPGEPTTLPRRFSRSQLTTIAPCPSLRLHRGPQRQVFVAGVVGARVGNHECRPSLPGTTNRRYNAHESPPLKPASRSVVRHETANPRSTGLEKSEAGFVPRAVRSLVGAGGRAALLRVQLRVVGIRSSALSADWCLGSLPHGSDGGVVGRAHLPQEKG